MSGNNVLLDSNIIIYLSQGRISVDDLIFDDIIYVISAITYMEVLGYQFASKDEEEAIQDLLNQFKIIYIDDRISRKVIEIRKKNNIKLPDAIICATAIVCGATLYTNDKKLEKIMDLDTKFIKVNG
jgi:predicted nucleic acid-binding protein